ncbi:MAG: DUF1345 domain-containing protein [Leucobacter sp.]
MEVLGATDRRSFRRALGASLSIGGEVTGLLLQIMLAWLGARIIWASDHALNDIRLLSWCIVASVYLGATIMWLNVLARFDQPDQFVMRLIVSHPLTRALSTLLTFGASGLGLVVAIDLIASLGANIHNRGSEFLAVWAMMLSWALFNWGYARIYFSRYHRAKDPPLIFPGTPEPRLIDFVYLAFTNSTTFSVPDVQVVQTRMRWTLVWHTTLAFFFNALIIVLTMNVISNGSLFADLID